MSRDVGKRGIGALVLRGDLESAARAIFASSGPGVAVFTGFPCVQGHAVPTENDGLAGSVAIARAALLLGKSDVAFVTDDCNRDALSACRSWLVHFGKSLGLTWDTALSVVSFPSVKGGWTDDSAASALAMASRYQTAVAIERAGRAADGRYAVMAAVVVVGCPPPLMLCFSVGVAQLLHHACPEDG